jgi:translation initiation factor 3 subunit L
MIKQADKSYLLLGIARAFFPTAIDETVQANINDKNADRIARINKYDINAFNDSFNYGSPKLFVPIRDAAHFKNFGFEVNFTEPVTRQREALSAEFNHIQELNNLRGVLKLYSTIKVDKLAAVLNKTPAQLQDLIKLYRSINNSEPKANPFEQTIIKRLVESIPSLDFVIEGDLVKVNDKVTQQNYSKLFYKNINKIEEITREIQAL